MTVQERLDSAIRQRSVTEAKQLFSEGILPTAEAMQDCTNKDSLAGTNGWFWLLLEAELIAYLPFLLNNGVIPTTKQLAEIAPQGPHRGLNAWHWVIAFTDRIQYLPKLMACNVIPSANALSESINLQDDGGRNSWYWLINRQAHIQYLPAILDAGVIPTPAALALKATQGDNTGRNAWYWLARHSKGTQNPYLLMVLEKIDELHKDQLIELLTSIKCAKTINAYREQLVITLMPSLRKIDLNADPKQDELLRELKRLGLFDKKLFTRALKQYAHPLDVQQAKTLWSEINKNPQKNPGLLTYTFWQQRGLKPCNENKGSLKELKAALAPEINLAAKTQCSTSPHMTL